MRDAFVRQETILRTVAARHGGYVYKMIGDAFQVAFDTARDALHATIDAQRLLQAEEQRLALMAHGAGGHGAGQLI